MIQFLVLLRIVFCYADNNTWKQFQNTDDYYMVHRSTNGLDYAAASSYCNNLGASLASVHSKAENDFIYELARYPYLRSWDENALIGFRKTETHRNWNDGTKVDYTNWAEGEPNSHITGEECTVIYSSAQAFLTQSSEHYNVYPSDWNDLQCNTKFKSIACKKQKVPSDETWIQFQQTDDYYLVHRPTNGLDYSDASVYCNNRGASLASIHSKAENDFVYEIARHELFNGLKWDEMTLIGLRASEHDGHWEWNDGTELDYTNWAKGEPNNHDEECTVMFTSMTDYFTTSAQYHHLYKGDFVDIHCNVEFKSIVCKKQKAARTTKSTATTQMKTFATTTYEKKVEHSTLGNQNEDDTSSLFFKYLNAFVLVIVVIALVLVILHMMKFPLTFDLLKKLHLVTDDKVPLVGMNATRETDEIRVVQDSYSLISLQDENEN